MISLIPISDANPTRRFPIVTIVLIALNVVAFLQTPGFGTSSESNTYFIEHAPIPCQMDDSCPGGLGFLPDGRIIELSQAEVDRFEPDDRVVDIPDRDLLPFLIAILFSTFLHAGFLHIAGNMLFLWVFGNNIEDFLGPVKYVAFYLLGGIAAALAHIVTHLDSAPVPSVGASGAVAAVMGAYLLLYPHARVKVMVIFFLITFVELSALIVLGIWFVYQFLIGAQELAGQGGVAWMAHVGGFVFGVIAIFLFGGRPHPRQRTFEIGRY